MIAICCMVSSNMVANADNDKPISVNALPAKAQILLNNHFNGQKVMLATIELGVVSRNYDVVLQNGTKLEFDKKGNLTEIDCKRGIVPALLIPASVESLGTAFKGSSLRTITFEKGSKLESISGVHDLGAFDGAINLTTVDMSECTQVKRIDEYTFYGNSNLRLFKIGTEIPPTCKDYTFYNINPYSVLKVPSGCTDAYKKATGWKKFASITGLDE